MKINEQRAIPQHKTNSSHQRRIRRPYRRPHLTWFGSLRQIVRGATAKGVDCSGNLHRDVECW